MVTVFLIEEEIFRVKKILENLKKTKENNLLLQKLLSEKYEKLNEILKGISLKLENKFVLFFCYYYYIIYFFRKIE